MDNNAIRESLIKAKLFVLEGGEEILNGRLNEVHGVSASLGATAIAVLALSALGKKFENVQRQGLRWLMQNRLSKGWGKFPGDTKEDAEITKLVQTVIQVNQGGWLSKVILLTQMKQFSRMILSLGQNVVPGLEGPNPEEIMLPQILNEKTLNKLPLYGRPVVVAAALLAAKENQPGIKEGLDYLKNTQMGDGSWAEDIVATSMGILAFSRFKLNLDRTDKAGHWLTQRQYSSGGWPAFDQLENWAIGWMVNIFSEIRTTPEEEKLIKRAVKWLDDSQNDDGSYGSTPPYTHPDLDDTAVAVSGIQQYMRKEKYDSVNLLISLQNEDGSWGTFPSFKGVPPNIKCEFPVYIPSVDVTIHVLEALWKQNSRVQNYAVLKGLNWLLNQQGKNGEFPSVWFEGSIYSTAQAIELLSKWKFNWEQWKSARQIYTARKKAQDFLLTAQNEDGSWGNSIVETSLALAALRYNKRIPTMVIKRGIENLINKQKLNGSFEPAYKGIYAKGWNYEEPLSTALTAIRALDRMRSSR